MTAHIYTFPISHDLSAARKVMAAPAAHPADVVETAATVLDWHGTDADRARIAHLPDPGLVTGRTAAQLAAARRIALVAGRGERQSLPTLLTAQEVLETHGVAEDGAALVQIEASAMLQRMAGRKRVARPRATIREELVACAGLAVIVAVCWALLRVGV